MTSSVFLKTYGPDLRWVAWCFRFLKQNWLTDSEFVVCAPADCTDSLKGLQELLGHKINILTIEQWPNGFVHQQYIKMCADDYCQGDYITFMDSDSMLVKPTDLEKNLLVAGKPLVWYTEYSRLPGVGWYKLVNQVLALQPEYEFMRCFPFTYHKSTLKACRDHIERMHGKKLSEFMIQEARTWTEFNVLGFYAYVFENSRYEWRDTNAYPECYGPKAEGPYRQDRVRQFFGKGDKGDWHSGTVAYLTAIAKQCGFEVQESPVDTEAVTVRVVKTPPKGQQALIDKILPHIVPGQIAIDVGAHEGVHSLAYAKAGAIVYAFEPTPLSFIRLWRALFELGYGTAMPLAISDKKGQIFFHEDKECTEANYASNKRTTETAAVGEEIPTQSLDELFIHSDERWSLRGHSEQICLIKIDVEGFEPLVLRGAKILIETYHPVISVECQKATLERNGFSKADIETFLKDHGYELEISTTDPRASTRDEDYFYDVIARFSDKLAYSTLPEVNDPVMSSIG